MWSSVRTTIGLARRCALLFACAHATAILVAAIAPQQVHAYAATPSYTCPSGGTLSGTTCTLTQAATWQIGYYHCPSGGTLSGTNCVTSSTKPAFRNYGSCPAGYFTAWYIGECWHQNNSCPGGYSWMNSGSFNDVFDGYTYSWSRSAGCYSGSNSTLRPISSYSCPQGGTLSGTNCNVSSSYAASYQPGYYSCPGGWSLSGSTCTSTYTASVSYSCPSGGVLSGTRCLPTAVTVRDGAATDVAYDNTTPLDANWTSAVGGTIADYSWCFTTSTSCASGVISSGTLLVVAANSGAAALSSGITYRTCVRARDTTNDYGAWACSNGQYFDAIAPPAITTLNAPTVTLVAPALSWTTVADAHSGNAYYRVYRSTSSTGPWSQVSTDGAPVTGSFTDSAAPFGSWFYRVQAVDGAGNEAAASNLWSVTYTSPNTAPNTPALVSPAGGTSTVDTTPDLVAAFSDPDGADTGTIGLEVCTAAFAPAQTCVGAGGTLLASGSSPAGIANGANGTWTVAPALVPQVVYWRARATDNGALQSAWSAARTLTIAETITIGVDSATLALGSVQIGTDTVGTTIVDVQSDDPQGYTLAATDESDTWGADCVCADTIIDWTGTGAAPSVWAPLTSGPDGYFGVTVRDTTGQSDNRLAKWGTTNATGWPATDYTNNRYAGLDNSMSIVLHDTTAAAPADTITVTTRTTPSATTTAGTYDATITLTATGKP